MVYLSPICLFLFSQVKAILKRIFRKDSFVTEHVTKVTVLSKHNVFRVFLENLFMICFKSRANCAKQGLFDQTKWNNPLNLHLLAVLLTRQPTCLVRKKLRNIWTNDTISKSFRIYKVQYLCNTAFLKLGWGWGWGWKWGWVFPSSLAIDISEQFTTSDYLFLF